MASNQNDPSMGTSRPVYTVEEVAKHNQPGDAWIIIDDGVYDVTKFAKLHPGGAGPIHRFAGQDVTEQFYMLHSDGVLAKYHDKLCVGKVKGKSPRVPRSKSAIPKGVNPDLFFGDQIPYGDPNWYQGWMSPYYKKSHRELRAYIRKFVEKEVIPYAGSWDEAYKIPKDVYAKAAQAQWLAAMVPPPWPAECTYDPPCGIKREEFDAFHSLIIQEELCRAGSAGVLWGFIGGLAIGLPPIIHEGSDYLKKKVVADCLNGTKFICLAVTEPWGGSDVAHLKTTAKLTEDGKYYIVNGEKKWITNGIFADYFTTAVRTGDDGPFGVSLLLIERNMPGVETKHMKCQGVWASGTTYVTFTDVKVPVENLIGDENLGFKAIMHNFNPERIGSIIGAVSFARLCIEESFKYAVRRKTFGKRLIDHAVIRAKIAEMIRMVESTHAQLELIIYQAHTMDPMQSMRVLGGPIALCKVQASKTLEFCAREAVQIFGGNGYTRSGLGAKIERIYRDVRAYAIPAGSEEIMQDLGIKMAVRRSKL